MNVNWRAILLLAMAVLSSGAQQASAQTTQAEPAGPVQAGSDPAGDRAVQDEHATTGMRQDDDSRQAARDESRPPHLPVTDETVGSGSSIDRAPRDIREPFDE